MNRTAKVGASVAVALLLAAGTATAATAGTAQPSKTYTVSKTFGPYNGGVKWGEPGSPPDHEARVVYCKPGEAIVKGAAKVNRKTVHGTTSRDVLTIDVIGAFWNSEVDMLQWSAWIKPAGRKGWNSVTFTLTCRRS